MNPKQLITAMKEGDKAREVLEPIVTTLAKKVWEFRSSKPPKEVESFRIQNDDIVAVFVTSNCSCCHETEELWFPTEYLWEDWRRMEEERAAILQKKKKQREEEQAAARHAKQAEQEKRQEEIDRKIYET